MTPAFPDINATKAEWRRWARARRQGLDIGVISAQVVAGLLDWPPFQRAEHVLSYHAFGSEVSLAALEPSGKTFYLTRTWESAARGLTIHRADGEMEPHPFGYLQPHAESEAAPPDLIDLVLVPGLAFDRRGTRLGYGLGYYDRLLPTLRPDAPRVGVVAEALIAPALPCEPFDVPMTHLVSEAGVVEIPVDVRGPDRS